MHELSFVIALIGLSAIVAAVGYRRGLDWKVWAIFGAFLFIVALPLSFFAPPTRNKGSGIKTLVIITLGLIALIIASIIAIASEPYDCENLEDDIVNLSIEGKMQSGGIWIAGITDIETISISDTEIQCSGISHLSNTLRPHVTYKATLEKDRWWIEYHLSAF